MNELRLSEIYVYPIKSLGGISVRHASVMEKGLELDRRWMLVDENGVFMTQRTQSALALFTLTIENSELRILSQKTSSNHTVFINPDVAALEEKVVIWDDAVDAFEVSEDTSSWFSEILGKKCRLIHFPEKNSRAIDKRFASNNEDVSLADGYPYLIIGQASLDYLNTKLEIPLPMNRFRPNFVFTGGDPNVEDTWRNFSIGQNRFLGVKPCSRCVLTTINQSTAEKGDEPLRTLATYRKENNKILFGQNLISVDHKKVSVGDLITIA